MILFLFFRARWNGLSRLSADVYLLIFIVVVFFGLNAYVIMGTEDKS